MKKLIFFTISLSLAAGSLLAQRPVVSGISPKSATVNELITISGTNLPTGSDAHVQFGAAKGSITEASSSQIKVKVPAGASYEGISVVNLTSAQAGKSTNPFLLAFGGTSFDPTRFTTDLSFAGNTGMFDVCACDFNADGLVDAVTSHENNLSLSAFLNTSTLTTPSFTKTSVVLNAYSRNVICGDMDGDGKPDLIVSGSGINGNRIYLLRNTSSTGGALQFAPAIALPLTTSGAAMLALQDLNSDGRPEILGTNRSSNVISIYKNLSTPGSLLYETQATELTISGFANTHGLAVQDLDGDGLADIAVTPFQGSGVALLRNTSSSTSISFSTAATLSSASGLINLLAIDLSGDGKLDLAASNWYTNEVLIWPNTSSSGTIQYGTASTIVAGTQPWGLAAGDLDGNGRPELVVNHTNSRSLFVIRNTSTTSSLSLDGLHIATTENGRHASVIDFNGDGKPDLAYTGTSNNNLRILRNQHCIQPVLSHTGSHTVCSGQTLTIQATQAVGVSYTWTRNGTPLSATTSYLQVSEAGTYAVTIGSAADGCSLTSETVQIVSGSGSTGSVAMEPIAAVCVGGSALLKATAISGATYIWSGPNGFTTTTTTASHTLNNVQTSAAGSYSVVIKSGDCQFTPPSQSLTVHTNPTASITASSTAFCAGTSVTLQAPTGFASYQWKLNGANYTGTGATTASITTGTAGSYIVVITNSNGCSAESAAVTITQTQAPVASFTAPASACLQQPVTFQNTSTFASGQTPSYIWSFGDGNTSTQASPSHTYAAVGNYTVNLTVSYGSGSCSNSTSKTISVVASPEVSLLAEGGITAFCPGESVLLYLEGDVASVIWNTGATTPTLTAADAGTYRATITTSAGCTLERTIDLTHLEIPAISISASSNAIAIGETVTLTAGGALRYEWEASEDIEDLYSSTVTVTPSKTTTYTVSGWGGNGCAATTTITIVVDNSLRINPPKIFLPAIEGTWVVGDIDLYPDLSLTLVNSLGRIFFEAKPYLNNWDGTERGRMLEAGVYYYIFKDASGKVVKSGSITLLR